MSKYATYIELLFDGPVSNQKKKKKKKKFFMSYFDILTIRCHFHENIDSSSASLCT